MKYMDWIVFSVVSLLLLGMANQAENLIPVSFEAGKFVPSVVEARDNLYGVCTVGEQVVWMAGTNGKLVRSDDGGNKWYEQETGIPEHLQDLAAWDESRAVAVGNNGVIIVTDDQGKTWQRVEAPRSGIANKLMRVKTGQNGKAWAVGVMGAILGTADYGATWARLAPEEDIGWNGIDFSDAQHGWIVGEFGRAKRSADAGASWEEVEEVAETSLMAVAFRDPEHGVAVGLEGTILTTSDGGSQWTPVEDGATGEHLWDVYWHDHSGSWVCVGNQGTYVVGDQEGQEWKAARLSDTELLWHTSAAAAGSKLFIVGGSQGVLQGGRWSYLF